MGHLELYCESSVSIREDDFIKVKVDETEFFLPLLQSFGNISTYLLRGSLGRSSKEIFIYI